MAAERPLLAVGRERVHSAAAAWAGVGRVLYINLARRADRRAELEAELARVGVPTDIVERMEAIDGGSGPAAALACARMHLAAARRAQAGGWTATLVLEDDFDFHAEPAAVHAGLARALAPEQEQRWDVLLLTATGFSRGAPVAGGWATAVSDAQGAAGYLVRGRYVGTLADHWAASVAKLAATGYHWLYAPDQAWKALQAADRWVLADPMLGRQRPSFSDLAGRRVDYHPPAQTAPPPAQPTPQPAATPEPVRKPEPALATAVPPSAPPAAPLPPPAPAPPPAPTALASPAHAPPGPAPRVPPLAVPAEVRANPARPRRPIALWGRRCAPGARPRIVGRLARPAA